MNVRLGVDFDNTVVCYDGLFHRIAVEKAWIPAGLPAAKGEVRDYLRRAGREEDWIELQGIAYGARLGEAVPFEGALELLARCRRQGNAVHIVSHKTKRPFKGPPCDLHQAAMDWLRDHKAFDPSGVGLTRSQVHLKLTKEEKLEAIRELACTHFVDDLPEFLEEPGFPEGVERLLFDPNGLYLKSGLRRAGSWKEVGEWLP